MALIRERKKCAKYTIRIVTRQTGTIYLEQLTIVDIIDV